MNADKSELWGDAVIVGIAFLLAGAMNIWPQWSLVWMGLFALITLVFAVKSLRWIRMNSMQRSSQMRVTHRLIEWAGQPKDATPEALDRLGAWLTFVLPQSEICDLWLNVYSIVAHHPQEFETLKSLSSRLVICSKTLESQQFAMRLLKEVNKVNELSLNDLARLLRESSEIRQNG
jgi:hypothetical protein